MSELTTIFGSDVISQEKVNEIIANKSINEEIDICFNDYSMPLMDEKNTVLVSQKNDDLYYGILTSNGYIVNVIRPGNKKGNSGLERLGRDDRIDYTVEVKGDLYSTMDQIKNIAISITNYGRESSRKEEKDV